MASISIKLNSKGIKDAIEAIEQRRALLTEDSLTHLRQAIAERITNYATAVATGAILDDTYMEYEKGGAHSASPILASDINITQHEGPDSVTFVVSTGKDMVWLEFGAGVHYNGAVGSKPNPLAGNISEVSGIGQYGKGRGASDSWIFSKNGVRYRTHGTPAVMPLFHAIQDVENDFIVIARGVLHAQP